MTLKIHITAEKSGDVSRELAQLLDQAIRGILPIYGFVCEAILIEPGSLPSEQRCQSCNNTGRIISRFVDETDYCTCPMGRDVKRVEARLAREASAE